VQGVWELAVGTAIAAAATPKTEHGGVLTVTCQTAAWAHELDLMSEELIQRLNRLLDGEILTGLRCRTV
jgi:predicted nucleic acid-binding Zn ribbon protein